ncbi:YtpR family tRNA-binding protein [Salibacterium sp. K-3]
MNVFYNNKGIGDTLLVSLKEIDKPKREIEKQGDVVRLYHEETGETAGFHIFHASSYGNVNQIGLCALTDSLKELIQNALAQNGLGQDAAFPEEPSFIVGYVTERKKHPDADKLSVCQVDTGRETLQIVCGAPNVKKDQKVVVALPGAFMPSGMKIKKSKLRGVSSNGMICSAKELMLPEASEEKGILVLDDSYSTGGDFLMQFRSR